MTFVYPFSRSLDRAAIPDAPAPIITIRVSLLRAEVANIVDTVSSRVKNALNL